MLIKIIEEELRISLDEPTKRRILERVHGHKVVAVVGGTPQMLAILSEQLGKDELIMVEPTEREALLDELATYGRSVHELQVKPLIEATNTREGHNHKRKPSRYGR